MQSVRLYENIKKGGQNRLVGNTHMVRESTK